MSQANRGQTAARFQRVGAAAGLAAAGLALVAAGLAVGQASRAGLAGAIGAGLLGGLAAGPHIGLPKARAARGWVGALVVGVALFGASTAPTLVSGHGLPASTLALGLILLEGLHCIGSGHAARLGWLLEGLGLGELFLGTITFLALIFGGPADSALPAVGLWNLLAAAAGSAILADRFAGSEAGPPIMASVSATGTEARRGVVVLGPAIVALLWVIALGAARGWYGRETAFTLGLASVVAVMMMAATRALRRLDGAERLVHDAVVAGRRNEDRFRAALEAAPSAMLLIDQLGRIVLCNGRAEADFGYEPGTLVGVALDDLVPERYRRGHESLRRKAFHRPEVRRMGQRPFLPACRRDGTEFPAEVIINPVVATDGMLVLASVVDATARVEAEVAISRLHDEIKEREERLALAIRGSHDGILDWHHARRHLWLSRQAWDLLGLGSKRQITLVEVVASVHRDDQARLWDALRRHLRSEDRLEVEVRVPDSVHGERWLRIRAEAIRDGGRLARSAGSITETTAHRRLIETVLESAQRLRVALDNHEVGFWEWNLTTAGVVWDQRFNAIHGVDGTAVSTTKPAAWIALVHPDDRRQVEEALRTGLVQSQPVIITEYRIRGADGKLRWVRCRGRIVDRNDEGQAVRMLGTVEDITSWKRVEGLLEAKNRELQSLLHVTSHDLREPLRAILGFSKIVATRYRDPVGPEGRDLLDRVVRAAVRLEQLINDIWMLSRVRRVELPDQAVPVANLVAEAIARLDERIRETGAEVTILPDLPVAAVEPTWVTEAVYNLVLNALKFVRFGERPSIEIGPWRSNQQGIGLVVRDRGPGVPPEHSERIFRLFQRAVGREVEGTGAGLAIVREVAERHGGKAWVQGREGGGSEFVITLSEPNEGGAQCAA